MKASGFLQSRGSLLLSTLLITTLVVPLSTVGFVSLQSYKQDARSTLLREHISLLAQMMGEQGASGIDLTTLIHTESGDKDKTVHVSAQKTIYGETSTEKLITKAGDVTWISYLDVNDQYGKAPLVGIVSTPNRSALQVATTINHQVYIKGNFTPDSGENEAKGLIQNPSGTSELVDGDYGKHR